LLGDYHGLLEPVFDSAQREKINYLSKLRFKLTHRVIHFKEQRKHILKSCYRTVVSVFAHDVENEK